MRAILLHFMTMVMYTPMVSSVMERMKVIGNNRHSECNETLVLHIIMLHTGGTRYLRVHIEQYRMNVAMNERPWS